MDKLNEQERSEVLKKSAIIKIYTIAQVLKCIELASERGAYKPSEMTFVGSVYDTLSKGLSQAFQAEINNKEEEEEGYHSEESVNSKELNHENN